jgi:hypothetical protein
MSTPQALSSSPRALSLRGPALLELEKRARLEKEEAAAAAAAAPAATSLASAASLRAGGGA